MSSINIPRHQERLHLIDKCGRLIELYRKILETRPLNDEEKAQYANVLAEYARIRRIEDGFQSIFTFGITYFSSCPPTDFIRPNIPSPEFHHEICALLREKTMSPTEEKLAIAAPRSHAKSVWVTNIFPVWVTVYKDDIPTEPYWMIVGDKEETANGQLEAVKLAFATNEKIIEDFGDLVGKNTWNTAEIITANGVKFETAGMREGVRGRKHGSARPNVLFDDVEKDEDVSTPAQIKKIINKFDQAFMNLGGPTSKFFIVGTILAYSSLLNTILNDRGGWTKRKYSAVIRFPDRMDLWEKWAEIYRDRSEGKTAMESSELAFLNARRFYDENKEEMDKGSFVLWPERKSLYDLMVLRITNRLAFLTEYQNEPLDEETRVYDLSKLRYYRPDLVDFQEDFVYYFAVDPSMGKNKRSDFSAIIVGGRHKRTGLLHVIEADIRRRHPSQIILDVLRKHEIYNFKKGWVESVAFQAFFLSQMKEKSAELGIYVPVEEFPNRNRDKDARILAMEPYVTSGYVVFNPNHGLLLEQLEYFPTHVRKDGPDALAMLVEMLTQKRQGRVSTSVV